MADSTENNAAAATPAETGKKENVLTKKIPPLYLGIGAAVILIPVLMWGYGFVDAMSDVNDGLNLIIYKRKSSEMNLISRSGYRFYVRTFTDMEKRQTDFNRALEGLGRFGR